jgi:DNA gyrase subunit A
MSVFDLSQVQAEYILELRLRRLTRFSRIELESEQDTLKKEIADLCWPASAPPAAGRPRAGCRGRDVRHTPPHPSAQRRTRRSALSQRRAADLQIADSLPRAPVRDRADGARRTRRVRRDRRSDAAGEARRHPVRCRHDDEGRARRGHHARPARALLPVDLPSVPANAVQLAAGTRADQYLGLASGEHVVAVVPPGDVVIALGTAQGVVKRVATSELAPGKHEAEIIALKDGDLVVGAAGPRRRRTRLRGLRRSAPALRRGERAPQGRAAAAWPASD